MLLTPDKRLIEFPSILLPPNISSGSIVDITVGRNTTKEAAAEDQFRSLQDRIFQSFGASEPAAPILRCRNATQTSVVLEWDPIELATADLISLSLYRNGQKAGNIPRPLEMHSTKISGLAVDTEYSFHLVLRTSAGTRASEKVVVRTHKMTDLSGITITTGILPAATRESLTRAVERIGAKIVDGVRIDTTHFVTTEGRGTAWEKAVENNIPVVRPEWVTACEQNGRIFGVTKFYLDVMRPGPPSDDQLPPPPAKDLPPKDLPRRPSPQEQEAAGKKSPESRSPPAGPAPPATPPNGKKSPESGAEAGSKAPAEAGDDSDAQEEQEEGEAAEPKAKSTEQKARTNDQAEQKVRLEDVQGQLRPGGSQTAIVEEVAEGEEEDEDENKPASPPDGASFQEVEL